MSSVNDLHKNGFAVISNAVDEDACERALSRINELKSKHKELVEKNADEFGHLYRVVNLHRAIDELADAFALNQKGLDICDTFFGEPTSLYTTLYYERGSEQALHRDTPYFYTIPPGKYLGVWLALDDVDGGNGPLKVVPGSHLLPPIDVKALRKEVFGDAPIPSISMEGWNGYQAAVQRQCDERGMQPIEVHVKRGDVIIWHPEMFHGGASHVERERSRRSLVMHVTPTAVPVYHIDVFYDPSSRASEKAYWIYEKYRGRDVVKHDQVDFGHEYVVNAADLR